MFPRDATEIIWAFTGTVLGLIMCVGISAIVRQIRNNSTGSSQADHWENATDAVMGFLDGDEAQMARFSKLLKAAETRPIVIKALSNCARTNVNCAVRLRDRDADLAVLRQWVSDSLEDKDAGRRAHACEVVATLRLRTCRGMILAATSDEDVNVKVSARRAMAVIDPESAVGVLLGLIEDEGTWVADFLADLFQRIPASATEAVVPHAREWGATPALVKLLASSPSALANKVLLGALQTDDPELRARAADAIHASSPEAVAALCALLTDRHEGTRLSAVRSLSRASNPEALLILSGALSDSSRLVRFAAASGIAGTTGGAEVLSRVVIGSDCNAAEAAELALWRLNLRAPSVTTAVEALEEMLTAPKSLGTSKAETPDSVVIHGAQSIPVFSARAVVKSNVSNVSNVSKPVAAKPAAKPVESEPKPVAPKASLSKPVGSKASVSKPVGSKASVSMPVGSEASVSKSLAATSTESKTVLAPQPTIPNPADKQGRRSDNVLAWLEAFLVAKDGVASAPLVKAAAAAEGIAERTLERVRPSIATSARQGFGEPANWELITKRARDVTFV